MRKLIQWWAKPQPMNVDARQEIIFISLIALWVVNDLLSFMPQVFGTHSWIKGIVSLAFWGCFVAQLALFFWRRLGQKQGK